MNIVVSGSHGLIGSALVPALAARGDRVVRLMRAKTSPPGAVAWDPERGWVDAAALEGADAVIHLAGENIAAGRWTAAKKARIRDSRVHGTRAIAAALARLSRRPGVFLCASATGYYGNRGEEILVEESAPGVGFLANVCREWEAASAPARDAGIRVVHFRNGIVLSPAGGALAPLLLVFRLGLGGRLGSGGQFMSWITLDDHVRAIVYALTRDDLRGPVNFVSPNPVTNAEFTATLARVLRRPALFTAPAPLLRLALGEAAGELLESRRVHPAKLSAAGYTFRHAELGSALRDLIASHSAPRGGGHTAQGGRGASTN